MFENVIIGYIFNGLTFFQSMGLTYTITLNAHFKSSQKPPAGNTTKVHAYFRHCGQSQADLFPLYGIEPASLCCFIQ